MEWTLNKVYKYVQRRQMTDVCLKLTEDINLWQKIVCVLVQDAKWTMGGFKQVQFVQHLLNVPTLSCYTSSECSKCWTKVKSFCRRESAPMQCIAIACQWRPNEGREGISYESPRNQFNHVAAHYRKLFTVAINDKCAFIPCLGPAANLIMAILDKLNCRQAICQSANILQV